ncbi:unnamed protein product [Thlaspi arvense]|uniref:Uncharacterized protein n=1 Tax=Thlaspi arvense TaxID=13288 RepID=A0AAU9SG28_THLAR|nr:unnamed protein product [Thlaspi arvense]
MSAFLSMAKSHEKTEMRKGKSSLTGKTLFASSWVEEDESILLPVKKLVGGLMLAGAPLTHSERVWEAMKIAPRDVESITLFRLRHLMPGEQQKLVTNMIRCTNPL